MALISPSDNTGWGALGRSALRATGASFSVRQPVRVRAHYRSQWGQRNGRIGYRTLRKNLQAYVRRHYSTVRRRKRPASGVLVGVSTAKSAFGARVAARAVRSILNARRRRRRARR
ncbi:pVII protein [Barthadenovirus mellis]|uniref:PVII protein n=1 Tax=Passerine adenovirus 1 TaxID=2779174 RepID=A0A7L9DKB4_9ADEN|nr:pVII protein [Passerine adenovirus 1]